jgi:hypothetical protein
VQQGAIAASRVLLEPTIARPGLGPISVAGDTLVIREWTDSEPSYLHIRRFDDEAWHVLEGCIRFRFEHGEVDAPAGTTIFIPAGLAHTYRVIEPSRYLIFLTLRRDRLVTRRRSLSDQTQLCSTLAEFDTEMVE